jgi:phage-related protein
VTTTFTFQPSLGIVGTTNYLTRKAQFSDGYSQEVADGINNASDMWPLTFTGTSAKIAPIRAFIDALKGFQSFYWTPPLRAQGLFRANQLTVNPLGNGIYILTVNFTEVF